MAMPAARELFCRAIVESGSMIMATSAKEATASARALLAQLGLSEGQLDTLQTIPADQLYQAALAAQSSGEEGRVPATSTFACGRTAPCARQQWIRRSIS